MWQLQLLPLLLPLDVAHQNSLALHQLEVEKLSKQLERRDGLGPGVIIDTVDVFNLSLEAKVAKVVLRLTALNCSGCCLVALVGFIRFILLVLFVAIRTTLIKAQYCNCFSKHMTTLTFFNPDQAIQLKEK